MNQHPWEQQQQLRGLGKLQSRVEWFAAPSQRQRPCERLRFQSQKPYLRRGDNQSRKLHNHDGIKLSGVFKLHDKNV